MAAGESSQGGKRDGLPSWLGSKVGVSLWAALIGQDEGRSGKAVNTGETGQEVLFTNLSQLALRLSCLAYLHITAT